MKRNSQFLVGKAGIVGVAVIVIVMIVMVMVSGCISEEVKDVDLEVGDEVPEFEVRMSDGRVVSDESLRGDVSVVMFFHTGCPDCRATLPVMQMIYDEFASKRVNFAIISREEEDMDISAFWRDNGLEMPYSAQKDRAVYEKFATSGIPRVYVNDRDGIIRYVFTDNPVPEYDELESAIESLVD